MKELKQIVEAYDRAVSVGQRAALATVVKVEGSSYRQPGARMLVTEDGNLTGAISGGCLEGDAMRKALLVIARNKPMVYTYDTSDENSGLIWLSDLDATVSFTSCLNRLKPENRMHLT